MRKRRSGFTLLELLVVVIIIGILATVAVPQFIGFVDRSRESEAVNVITTLLTAELLYNQEQGSFTTDNTKLAVSIPSLRTWSTPVLDTSAAPPAGSNIEGTYIQVSLNSAGHGHAKTTDHQVQGWIDDDGDKYLQSKRPPATGFSRI